MFDIVIFLMLNIWCIGADFVVNNFWGENWGEISLLFSQDLLALNQLSKNQPPNMFKAYTYDFSDLK